MLLLAERLAPVLEERHTVDLAAPLVTGHLSDWNVVDWYATKALHAFLTARPEELIDRVHLVAAWSHGAVLWQRRAAVAAFVDEHAELSAEGRRMATARLRAGPYRRR